MPRAYLKSLMVVLPAGAAAGCIYAAALHLSPGVALAVLAAALIEVAFYLAIGFPEAREALERRFSRAALAGWLAASGVLPYLVYALPTAQFRWESLLLLAGLVLVASYWFCVLPRLGPLNLLFVALLASVILFKLFGWIYTPPAPRLRLEFLGQLMWIRLGVMAVLSIGRLPLAGGLRWLPSRKEWLIGVRYALYFLPFAAILGLALGFVRLEPRAQAIWLAPLVFTGMLWVVALSEELFFRGLLQEWFSKWLHSAWAGLVAAALLFGATHLAFRQFPNWRFALLAAVAGLFYGRACRQAGSIRAAMVAHALINTVWRTLFV